MKSVLFFLKDNFNALSCTFQPAFNVMIRYLFSDVIHKKGSHGASVIRASDSTVPDDEQNKIDWF